MSKYTPVSCAQSSEYELMAMHHKMVKIRLIESDQSICGRVVDVIIRNGVEYMVLILDDKQRKEIRLDCIKSTMADLKSG